jgi:CBS domain-containing protein
MKTVRQILQSKGKQVWSVPPDFSVYEALQLMAEKDLGALIVLEDERLVGVFSERDYARKYILDKRPIQEIAVRELMSSPVITVRPGQSVGSCMALMTDKHIRHLPVVDGQKLVGVISIGDVVKAIIAEQQNLISELGSIITKP